VQFPRPTLQLLGFAGPRQEAEQIKACIGAFLHDQLALEVSATKTLITHGRIQPARFLGYEIVVLHADHKHDHRGRRSINAAIGLKVPADVIRAKCAPYLHHGKPIRRTERIVDADFSIVAQFQAEFRGVAQYYKLAFNRHRLGRLKYVMQRSLTKTLARKYRIRVAQVYRRYRGVLDTERGPRRGLQVIVDRGSGRPALVAQWGGISLARATTPTVSTRTRPASGATAGQSSFNGLWPTPANYADPQARSRCTTSGHSKTSTPKGGNTNPNGSRGWPHAAARPFSSAVPAMKTSTPDVPGGNHEKHWRAGCHGNRARPVRRGAVEKGPDQTGTSPAAYPTARRVRQETVGKGPTLAGTSPTVYLTLAGWVYLATVIDCYSKAVIGWSMSDSLHTDLVYAAIDAAADYIDLQPDCVFHSDRGSQYTWSAVRRSLGEV
jgi:type II intron maturase/integrase-like protein